MKTILEMAFDLVQIGYHPEDVAGYDADEIKAAWDTEFGAESTDK